jgi:hypothetical protein
VARKTVKSLRHTSTITERLKSDTYCRRSVGEGFDRFVALEQFPRDVGWQVPSCLFGRPLMGCQPCAAPGRDPGWGVSAAAAGYGGRARQVLPFGLTRRLLPPGPVSGPSESLTAELPPEDEEFLAATEDEILPGTVKESRA